MEGIFRRHIFIGIVGGWQVIITFFFVLLAILNLVLHTKRIWIACVTVRALEQGGAFRELSQQGLETLKLSGYKDERR